MKVINQNIRDKQKMKYLFIKAMKKIKNCFSKNKNAENSFEKVCKILKLFYLLKNVIKKIFFIDIYLNKLVFVTVIIEFFSKSFNVINYYISFLLN